MHSVRQNLPQDYEYDDSNGEKIQVHKLETPKSIEKADKDSHSDTSDIKL